jgi:hypothetical protein
MARTAGHANPADPSPGHGHLAVSRLSRESAGTSGRGGTSLFPDQPGGGLTHGRTMHLLLRAIKAYGGSGANEVVATDETEREGTMDPRQLQK